MNWLHYLLEANIYLGVFYIAYCLFLNKETHYLLNRIYLVCSCVIAFTLPILKLGVLIPPPAPVAPAIFTTVPVTTSVTGIVSVAPVVAQQPFNLQDGLWYIYLAGAAIFAGLFIVKLISLAKLVIGKPILKHTDYNLVYIDESQTAFSFFNYLFIGKNTSDDNIITRHELVHIRQKHSADIIFLEVLKIISWFSPLFYLIQNSLKTVHEYIADEQSVDNPTDAINYSSFLVNNAYGLTGPSITHSFFTYNLLKKRIIMLNQQRSGNLARLKYLVAVPIGAGLLCASTLGFSKTYGWIDLAPQKPVKVTDVLIKEQPPIANNDKNNNIYGDFYEHLRNSLHFPASLKNKNFVVTLVASFELDKNGFIKNVSTNTIKSHPEISNDIVTAIESYKKPIEDKFVGKRFMILNFAAKNTPPPPSIDSKIGRDPGNLGTYLITDAPNSKLEIIKYPPPRVVPDNQVPPKPKVDQVKFPTALVPVGFKPEKTYVNDKGYKIQEGIGHNKYGRTWYLVIISDPSGKKIKYNNFDVKQVVAYKGLPGISEETLYNTFDYKFPNVKVDKFIDQVKFPPPIVKPDKNTPPKPKVDQVKFPPPVVKPDTSKKAVGALNKESAPLKQHKQFPVIHNDFNMMLAQYRKEYPQEALKNDVFGNVIAEFKVTDDQKLIEPRIKNGIGGGCDEYVLKLLNSYHDKIFVDEGTYQVAVSFMIDKNNGKYLTPTGIGREIQMSPNYFGQMIVVGRKTN